MRAMLLAGADKVGVNTAAVQRPETISEGFDAFGAQCIVVAIDAKRNPAGGWTVYTHGGRTPTELDAVAWAQEVEQRGAGELLLTSMDADGTKAGYDLELTAAVSSAVRIPVIASGGAGTLEHMAHVLKEGKADAVPAASIFHFGEFTVPDVKRYLASQGIPVRITNRMKSLRFVAITLLFAASALAAPPNIVVMLVDDMGVMDTSVPFLTDGSGQPKRYPLNDFYRTPNMERLAAQGNPLQQLLRHERLLTDPHLDPDGTKRGAASHHELDQS